MRRVIIVCLGMISSAVALASDPGSLEEEIRSLLKKGRGVYAVSIHDLDGNVNMSINADEPFDPASTMKTAVMIEVYRQARLGNILLDDSLTVRSTFYSVVNGKPYRLIRMRETARGIRRFVGKKMAIRDLVEAMITVSSNIATNMLIELLGPSNVTKTMRDLGAGSFLLVSGLEDTRAELRGLKNRLTAEDLAVILEAIAKGQAVDAEASAEMLEILERQHYRNKIPKLLPPEVRTANKTGRIRKVEHDSGIVFLPDGRAYVLVILSKGIQSRRLALRTIQKISKTVYDFFAGS